MKKKPAKLSIPRSALTKDENGDLVTAGSHHFGGNLAKNKKYARLFDVPRYKRHVRVTICKYMLGTHYWVTIKEEPNFAWDPAVDKLDGKVRGWTKAWNDIKANERTWDEKFLCPHQVGVMEKWIRDTIRENYGDKKIAIRLKRETIGATMYGREGD